MNNKGNFILSLSSFTRWLAGIAEEEYGVEIYPGFAGAQLLYSDKEDSFDSWGNPVRSVRGVITNEVGLTRDFKKKPSFEPGMVFKSKVTLLAEGAHGSLSKSAIAKYNLNKESQPQTYAIGVKEVWRVDPEKHNPGEVIHTMGWPLDGGTYGGGWAYHMDGGLVSLGLVIGLDYKNPYLAPYKELQVSAVLAHMFPAANRLPEQRMKHHPYFRRLLTGSATSSEKPERLAYGARVLTEGGLQSVPTLNFPGGALIGCSAGFVNIAKIKGTHNAMKSGMVAADSVYNILSPDAAAAADQPSEDAPTDLSSYNTALRNSWVWSDLHEVRNLRPSFNTRLGIWGGVAYSGIDSLFLKGRVPWTFKHTKQSVKDLVRSWPSCVHSVFTPLSYRVVVRWIRRTQSLLRCTKKLNIPLMRTVFQRTSSQVWPLRALIMLKTNLSISEWMVAVRQGLVGPRALPPIRVPIERTFGGITSSRT